MLRMDSVEPTVLFSRGRHGLLQVVKIVIESDSEAVEADVDVKLGSVEVSCPIDSIKSGREVYQIHVPDVREAVPAEFVLKLNGEVQDRLSMDWTPRKHWQIHLQPQRYAGRMR